jgi:hypothetical protein
MFLGDMLDDALMIMDLSIVRTLELLRWRQSFQLLYFCYMHFMLLSHFDKHLISKYFQIKLGLLKLSFQLGNAIMAIAASVHE